MNNANVKTFNRWRLEASDVRGLDASRARDLVINCFFEAQKETLSRAKQKIGMENTTDEEMKRTTATIVRMAFKDIGADFDNPTPKTLEQVVGILAQKAEAWGTPEDIIDHHRAQLVAMFAALK